MHCGIWPNLVEPDAVAGMLRPDTSSITLKRLFDAGAYSGTPHSNAAQHKGSASRTLPCCCIWVVACCIELSQLLRGCLCLWTLLLSPMPNVLSIGGQAEADAAYAEALHAVFTLKVDCHRHAQPHVSKKDGRMKWTMLEMWPMQASQEMRKFTSFCQPTRLITLCPSRQSCYYSCNPLCA